MCVEYALQANEAEIQNEFGVAIKNLSKKDSWKTRVKMTIPAPVIAMKEGEIRMNEVVFPANPFPNARLSQSESNKTREKISATDDQIIRIYEVPLWKTGFEKFPCIVPMTSFMEPAYWGKNRGDIVEFNDPKEKILFVPSILVKPRVPDTGLFNGFALLTHTASEQMLGYHHRLLVFLKPKAAVEYLTLGQVPPAKRFEFLLENRYVPEFKTSVDRTMAKGWDKRAAKHEESLRDEVKYIASLKST